MRVLLVNDHGKHKLDLFLKNVFCAGYAGRDQASVRANMDELAGIGVPDPARTPAIYPVSSYLLTNSGTITVQSGRTSGAVGFVLFIKNGRIYVTVGSDQTDRELETHSVARSKQVCCKAVASTVWLYEEIKPHWDSLILRTWVHDGQERKLYQEGTAAELMTVPDLMAAVERETMVSLDGAVIYSGTVPTREGFIFGKSWVVQIEDPVLKRQIKHSYTVRVLEEEMKTL